MVIELSLSDFSSSGAVQGTFNKKYRLNDRVSIFAAELYAIMQACSFVVDLPQPPLKVVIISDSKSSLQAIENSTTNRAELQEEIRFLCHQIITKGT